MSAQTHVGALGQAADALSSATHKALALAASIVRDREHGKVGPDDVELLQRAASGIAARAQETIDILAEIAGQ